MKLTESLKVSLTFADNKKDYVFDMHIAQKHNVKSLKSFISTFEKYIKQTQANEFEVTASQVDGQFNADSNLLSVTKTGLTYSVTTDYQKEFSAALIYDSAGDLKNDLATVSINTSDKTTINVVWKAAITGTYRVVLI